jgi:hypothetical protein
MKHYTSREDLEMSILEEVPYNWKKHYLFQLPEFFYFLFKCLVVWLFTEMILLSMASAVAKTMLEYSLK